MTHVKAINFRTLAKSLILTTSVSFSAIASTGPNPWQDSNNVYKYFKNSANQCLSVVAGCSSTAGTTSVSQFKKEWFFNGGTYGIDQITKVDVNGDGTLDDAPKYSGNLSTYTAKHYPVAVKHTDGMVYFVYSGPVKLENSSSFATSTNGNTTTSANFKVSGKSRTLGIYAAKYNPANDTVSQPVLVHTKFTDDPHDNAVINIGGDGHIYVLIAGRGYSRGAILYRSASPGSIDSFSGTHTSVNAAGMTVNNNSISPDNYNYSSFDTGFGIEGIAYPKMFWIDSDGGYFRLIYTVYRDNSGVDERNIFTARLNVNGTNPATLSHVTRIAGFKGHYVVANARGDDIVLAFNVHLNNSVDKRTNIYYMHSSNGGKTWQNANNTTISSALVTESALDQVAAREYYHNGQNVSRRIYLKDINFSGTGNNKKPIILYVGSVGSTSDKPSTSIDHYLAKSYFDGSSWTQARISNDVDHNYSSGMLVSDGSSSFDVYFPGTPEANNNALGGGAVAKTQTVSNSSTQYSVSYMTSADSPSNYSSPTKYLDRICEFNYIRPIHNNNSKTGLLGFSAAGNPYKYALESSANPIFMVKHNQVRMLPHNFSSGEVNNGFIVTIPNPEIACDPYRDI